MGARKKHQPATPRTQDGRSHESRSLESRAQAPERSRVPDATADELHIGHRDAARTRARTNYEAGDELGAAELARRVAESLRRFRAERQLSLDELSARCGVSRAALSQIEGCRTNPTLAVLWKIAVGLEVPFHDLLESGTDESVLVLRAGDASPLRSADGRTESRLLSPGGSRTDTEIYELRLIPKAILKSEPHARGTTETVIVLTGAMRLSVGGTDYDLSVGDSVYFNADVAHSYENRSSRETRIMDVIHYTKGRG
ncbi:MAG TPA: XRE family transcriptional regulator [Polyangiaceae bacterium]|nr:XRE family transcriptional regulator [Polyangiaceae bacterium]